MATVTLTITDNPNGTLKVTLESDSSFQMKDEGENTFAQNAGATALSLLMKKLEQVTESDEDE